MDTRMILKWVVNNLESNRPSHSLYLNSRTRSPARRPPASTTRSSTASSTRRNRRGMKPGSPPLLSVWMKACNDAPAFKRKKALVNVIGPMFICKEWSLCHRQKPWMWSTPGWEVPRLVNWDDSFSLESQQPLLSSPNILLLPFPQSCFPVEGPPWMTCTIAFMRGHHAKETSYPKIPASKNPTCLPIIIPFGTTKELQLWNAYSQSLSFTNWRSKAVTVQRIPLCCNHDIKLFMLMLRANHEIVEQ